MDPLNILLARIQFSLNIGVHYLFPPMTIGLSWLIFYMMTKYKNTGDPKWGIMAHFWTKIFALGFSVGVATGIVMEFSFGTNWANYSRFVGDIFGAPLAAEGILAFFLESSFLGVMLFGWKKFKIKTHWFASLMVAIGSTMSGFWIIAANSWQHTPAGYKIVNGRAELTNFFEALFNPSTIPRFLHVITGALLVGSFFMLGISAWYLVKRRDEKFARPSFKIALIVACVASIAQLTMGHWQAVRVWQYQPVKLAAMEGMFEDKTRAPLSLFGFPSADAEKTYFEIGVPAMLSIMLTGDPNTEIKGLNSFPRDEWPPLALTFIPYHLMIGLGTFFIGFTLLGVFLLYRNKLFESRWYLKAMLLTSWTAFVADHSGWIAAEVGRQPWIVWGLLRTSDAASPAVSTVELIISLIMFTAIYALLLGFWGFILLRQIKAGPGAIEPPKKNQEASA
jgi:cytochrome d ubiquinol oxidase subunit I